MARRRRHRTNAPVGIARPFTPEEDKELQQLARCGLSVDYWNSAIPGRTLGELLERRLELREAGELQLAAVL